MAEANIYLTLDTVLPNRERVFYGVSGDYGTRFIIAKITAVGNPLIIDGEAVTINFHRPDNSKASFSGHVNEDGTVTVPVVQWALDVPGEVKSSISCTTKSGRLTTTEFYIMAKATLWNGGNTSPDTPEIPEGVYIGIASITQTVKSDESGGANIWTVELTDGTKTEFIVKNGENGATFTPDVSSDGTLSWTNDKGLENPAPVNIKGADGKPFKIAKVYRSYSKMQDGVLTDGVAVGEYAIIDGSTASDEATKLRHGWIFIKEPRIYKFVTNIAGFQGLPGEPGEKGVSPTVSVTAITGGHRITITDENGTKTVDVMNGVDGRGIKSVVRTSGTGAAGTTDTYTITYTDNTTSTFTVYNGKDGTSVTVSNVTESTESGGENVVTFSDGKTLKVKNGKDYVLTETDKEEIVARAYELIKNGGVIGFVDENNNIILSGKLADGTYSAKYEMEDGSTIDIGSLVLQAEPTYQNFADPTSADWKEGYRLTTDINQVTPLTGGVVTNYIDVQSGDILEVTGINISDSNSRTAYDFGTDRATILKPSQFTNANSLSNVTYDANGVILTIAAPQNDIMKIRFSGLATGKSTDVVIKIKRNGKWL